MSTQKGGRHQESHVDDLWAYGTLDGSPVGHTFIAVAPLTQEAAVTRLDILSKEAHQATANGRPKLFKPNDRFLFDHDEVVSQKLDLVETVQYVSTPPGAATIKDARQFHGGHYGSNDGLRLFLIFSTRPCSKVEEENGFHFQFLTPFLSEPRTNTQEVWTTVQNRMTAINQARSSYYDACRKLHGGIVLPQLAQAAPIQEEAPEDSPLMELPQLAQAAPIQEEAPDDSPPMEVDAVDDNEERPIHMEQEDSDDDPNDRLAISRKPKSKRLRIQDAEEEENEEESSDIQSTLTALQSRLRTIDNKLNACRTDQRHLPKKLLEGQFTKLIESLESEMEGVPEAPMVPAAPIRDIKKGGRPRGSSSVQTWHSLVVREQDGTYRCNPNAKKLTTSGTIPKMLQCPWCDVVARLPNEEAVLGGLQFKSNIFVDLDNSQPCPKFRKTHCHTSIMGHIRKHRCKVLSELGGLEAEKKENSTQFQSYLHFFGDRRNTVKK